MIPVFLFLMALLFIFMASEKEKSIVLGGASPKFSNSSSARELVDRHLKMTNKMMEINQMRTQIQNEASAPQVGMRLKPEGAHWKSPVLDGAPMESDKNEVNSVSDLKNRKKQLNFQQPHPNVQGQIREVLDEKKFQQEYKKEYVRQFIENARLSGFDVTVNEDLIVISVKKINPVSATPFDPNSSGEQ